MQWVITAGVAIASAHDGAIYGDSSAARRVIADASRVANGAIPPTGAPLYSLLLAPLARTTTNSETISSIVTTLTIAILAPVASYCILDIAQRIAGRAYAIAVAAVWLLLPIASVRFFNDQYKSTYVDDVLPALYGLTVHPGYVAMVLSLAAAMFALRATADVPRAAFASGLMAAAAAACLPVAAGIIGGVVLALGAARRWRGLLEALAGIAAGIAPTLIWRHRAIEQAITLGRPSWNGFQASMANMREFSFSNRLFQWLPIAGTIGMFRLARPAAAMIAGWIAIATLVGPATAPSFTRGVFLLELVPAWPAYALAVAAIPALLPTLVRRLRSQTTPAPTADVVSRAAVWALVTLVVVIPAVAALVLSR